MSALLAFGPTGLFVFYIVVRAAYKAIMKDANTKKFTRRENTGLSS